MKWPTKDFRSRIRTAFGRLFRTKHSRSRKLKFLSIDPMSSEVKRKQISFRTRSFHHISTRRPKSTSPYEISDFGSVQNEVSCTEFYDPSPKIHQTLSTQQIHESKNIDRMNSGQLEPVKRTHHLPVNVGCHSLEFTRKEFGHSHYGDRVESVATIPGSFDLPQSPLSTMDTSNTLNDQNTLSFSRYTSSEMAISTKSSLHYRSDTLLNKPSQYFKYDYNLDVDSRGEARKQIRPSSDFTGLTAASPHNSVQIERHIKAIKTFSMHQPKRSWRYKEDKIISLARSAYHCADPPISNSLSVGLNRVSSKKANSEPGKESVSTSPIKLESTTFLNERKSRKEARECGDERGRSSGALLDIVSSPCQGLDISPSSLSQSILGSNYTFQIAESNKPGLKTSLRPNRTRQACPLPSKTRKSSKDRAKDCQSIPDPGLSIIGSHAEMGVRLVGHTRESDWKKHSFLNQNDRCSMRLQSSRSVPRIRSTNRSVEYPVRCVQKRREYTLRQRIKTMRGYPSRNLDGFQKGLNRNQISKTSNSEGLEQDKEKVCPTNQFEKRQTNSAVELESHKNDRTSRKASRLAGALPPSKDLDQCPTGRHPDAKPDKPCVCSLVKRMVIAQSRPVLYVWHANRKISDQPDNLEWEAPIPQLANYHLARPTRMVRGGQGTVAWVSNTNTGLYYALKFKTRDGRSESTWKIERREAKILKHTKHEFVVRLFHIYETEDTLFMALEWLDGGCLWNHVARLGTMPETYALYYAACVLSALLYLHSRQIVYRDMKAENIVLDQMGRPKLIDFGMAKYFDVPDKSQKADGNPNSENSFNSSELNQPPTRYYFAAYLAPEIYDHVECSNHLIDSWGLGYILIEMILGYGIFNPMPWEKQPGQHLDSNWKLVLPSDTFNMLSQPCSDFLHRMLVRKPESRLSLKDAVKHQLFARVPWSNLLKIRGPDLSKCKSNETNTPTTSAITSHQKNRKSMIIHDNYGRLVDLAFFRDFGVFCTFQPRKPLGHTSTFNTRHTKTYTNKFQKINYLNQDNRSLNTETEKFCQPSRRHGRNRSANTHNYPEKTGNSIRTDGVRSSRTVRRTHIPAN